MKNPPRQSAGMAGFISQPDINRKIQAEKKTDRQAKFRWINISKKKLTYHRTSSFSFHSVLANSLTPYTSRVW
jgi:hypothetical protein